ncbi:unnamed protein product [Effrenium voratum]|uniref:SSD domain-containing protein n=1 Tax=Effrenium voratum TaxID=2562239 RepID=A0AA36J1U5_9DINO|nr:unnamed protein product [Effrenium voratum]
MDGAPPERRRRWARSSGSLGSRRRPRNQLQPAGAGVGVPGAPSPSAPSPSAPSPAASDTTEGQVAPGSEDAHAEAVASEVASEGSGACAPVPLEVSRISGVSDNGGVCPSPQSPLPAPSSDGQASGADGFGWNAGDDKGSSDRDGNDSQEAKNRGEGGKDIQDSGSPALEPNSPTDLCLPMDLGTCVLAVSPASPKDSPSPLTNASVADASAAVRNLKEDPKSRRRCFTCRDFPFCTAHCPLLFALVVLLATPVLVAVLWPGFSVNNDTSVFLEADGQSNAIRAAFLGALPHREPARRLMTGSMPAIDYRDMYKIDKVLLYYRTDHPLGLLQPGALRSIQQLELGIRNGPFFQQVCKELTTAGLEAVCDPGYSLINAAFPSGGENTSEDAAYLEQRLNGRGRKVLRSDVIQRILMSKEEYKTLILPKSYTEGPIFAARTYFGFNMKCCRIEDTVQVRREQLAQLNVKWTKFLSAELVPKLEKFARDQQMIRLNYEGGGLNTLQLLAVLQSDCLFAIGSITFIISYLTLHAGSMLLSCGSMFLTILAIPVAFVLTALLSGSNEVTGAAFLSIFLIAGLGADVVLVFINFWEHSKSYHPESDTVARVKHVYQHAGLACLGTTCTTAASFFANLASVLRALREFGFFMGMCILGAYVYLLVGLPALLILNDKISCRKCLPSWCRVRGCRGCFGRLGGFCERLIVVARIPCFAFFLVLVLTFGAWTAGVVTVDVGVPQMFPAGHNLNSIEDVSADFEEAGERWTPDTIRICNFVRSQTKDEFLQCTVHQCQITLQGPLTILGRSSSEVEAELGNSSGPECSCFPSQWPSSSCSWSSGSAHAMVRTRVVGDLASGALETWRQSEEFKAFALEAAEMANPGLQEKLKMGMGLSFFQWSPPASGARPLKQEFWETGEIFTTNYEVLPDFAIPVELQNNSQLCVAETVCYCGAPACTYAGVERLVEPVVPTRPESQIALALTERRLQEVEGSGPAVGLAPRSLLGAVDVALVWGLSVEGGTPLLGTLDTAWRFSAQFRPEAPSTQRFLLQACELPSREELLVISSTCWITQFKDFAAERLLPFPLQANLFQKTFSEFVDGRVLPNGILAKEFMWLGENFELKATYFQFYVTLNYMTAASATILTLKNAWDQAVVDLNQKAPVELGQTWHTSSLWIRAEAEMAIVNSTILTMIVSAACGFLGALFFTHCDLLLSLMVVLNVVGVTVSLAWFMLVVMGWAVGVLEILGLIVFVGYSITYSLHIAHKYQEHTLDTPDTDPPSERRRQAVVFALKTMSGSIVGSAVTTLGSSFFLFFCQLVIFVKLATVLFSVTFFACLFATVALPAALLVLGPLDTSCARLMPWAKKLRQRAKREAKEGTHRSANARITTTLAKKIPLDSGTSTKTEIFLSSSPRAFRSGCVAPAVVGSRSSQAFLGWGGAQEQFREFRQELVPSITVL